MPSPIELQPTRPIDPPPVRRASAIERAVQVIDYLFGALYTLIGFEFVLELFGARDGNVFKRFLDAVTDPFLSPFRTLLPTYSFGGSEVIVSYVVALIAYAVLHMAVHRLARMAAEPAPPIDSE